MKKYKFTEKSAKKAASSQSLLTSLALLSVVLFIFIYTTTINPAQEIKFLLHCALVICLLCMFMVSNTKKKKLLKTSYRITDTFIEKLEDSEIEYQINFEDIEKCTLNKKGLFIRSSGQNLSIPKQVELFEELSQSIINRVNTETP